MRTSVYVDGFNLFYGALKGTDYKWLNLVELARRLVPEEYALERLRYFTARVSGQSDPGEEAAKTQETDKERCDCRSAHNGGERLRRKSCGPSSQ